MGVPITISSCPLSFDNKILRAFFDSLEKQYDKSKLKNPEECKSMGEIGERRNLNNRRIEILITNYDTINQLRLF